MKDDAMGCLLWLVFAVIGLLLWQHWYEVNALISRWLTQ